EVEVVIDLFGVRRLNKTLGTYVEKLPKAVNRETGKIRANYNPNRSATGRFRSGGDSTNMRNQSPDAQKLFVAPPRKVWIEADSKAQENRAAAYRSGEQKLLDGFRKGEDPYATMASNFYGKPHDEVYKLPNGDATPERKEMKVV